MKRKDYLTARLAAAGLAVALLWAAAAFGGTTEQVPSPEAAASPGMTASPKLASTPGAAASLGTPASPVPSPTQETLDALVRRAEPLSPLNSLLIAQNGESLVEEYFRGMRADRAVNVKSVSKTLLSPAVGTAIRDGLIEGTDQPLYELLPDYFERGDLAPWKREVTLHHLLSMTTGIETTSFGNYGAWVSSRDWAWDALRRPMECPPGSCFEYSTGNTHLLSVILTRVTGMSTREYLRRSVFDDLGIRVHAWDRDPQGRYLGGNNMALRPGDLLRFGQLFLDGGVHEGRQLVPWEWILASWRPNATSPWNGHHYGYLWWIEEWGGERAYFAWGYGGQYVVVVPRLRLVSVVTSALEGRRRGHTRRLRDFFDEELIPAFRDAAG